MGQWDGAPTDLLREVPDAHGKSNRCRNLLHGYADGKAPVNMLSQANAQRQTMRDVP